jgi:hypothetical protein
LELLEDELVCLEEVSGDGVELFTGPAAGCVSLLLGLHESLILVLWLRKRPG